MAREVCPDVMVPHSKVSKTADLFGLVRQIVLTKTKETKLQPFGFKDLVTEYHFDSVQVNILLMKEEHQYVATVFSKSISCLQVMIMHVELYLF